MFLNDYYKKNIKISNSPYLGLKYKKLTFKNLNKFFSKTKFKIFKLQNNYKKLCGFLHEGKIVATFVGRSEFGPRALGNRSILTRTYPAQMKDYLNNSVKFREEFRPFAPAVLDIYANEYFNIKGESFNMTKTFSVKKNHKIEAVTHTDQSARVQVVRKKDNIFFYKLIKNFYNFNGVPILLNTSFNIKGQPIVENIYDAVETFKKTKIDILLTENYFIKKVDENNNTRSK
jgi:carbamoyltransferase